MKIQIVFEENGKKKKEDITIGDYVAIHRYAHTYIKKFNTNRTPQQHKKTLLSVKIVSSKTTKSTTTKTKEKDSKVD